MGKYINFNKFLSDRGTQAGYVRKILAVKENEKQVAGRNYGTISKSYYYSQEERSSIYCNEGDCFVIRNIIQEEKFNQRVLIYFLVTVDFNAKNHLQLLDCTCRIGSFESCNFPYPENIFVEKLIHMGLFEPEKT